MQVVEKGMVGLDDDLGKVVPDLSDLQVLDGFDENGKAILTKATKALTLRHLLTHSSGFGYDSWDADLITWRQSIGSDINSNSFSYESLKIPLKFQPGEGWIYGIGLDWAGQIIQKLTGQSLEDYTQDHIFQPLGMTSTTFRIVDHPELQSKRADMGLRPEPYGPLTIGQAFKPDVTTMDCGGVGLYSTAKDYGRLLGALLDGGDGILKPDSVHQLYQPQLPDPKQLEENFFGDFYPVFSPEYPKGSAINYGLGGALNLEDIPGKRRAGSVMWTGATNPRWWLDPKAGIAAALMVQVLPPADTVVSELYAELEKAVYE
ncbi:beta-lactamase/transpeptidase-like protein [Exophiala viscosa]|uniref:Beta-lactamase/transpeptidase-like protein n=1 Tax=Exophiala viscosa TaxID=2486360 RepID=A0AAN6E1B2_9EURO|nr:beta-lactamase/transpeptidase-like protein [Exophiala viscosa]